MFHTSTSNTDIGAWNVARVSTFMYAVVRRRAPP